MDRASLIFDEGLLTENLLAYSRRFIVFHLRANVTRGSDALLKSPVKAFLWMYPLLGVNPRRVSNRRWYCCKIKTDHALTTVESIGDSLFSEIAEQSPSHGMALHALFIIVESEAFF